MSQTENKISIRPGYVLVERPTGYEISLRDQPEMLAELAGTCEDAGCRKVLILGPKTKVDLTVMDIYDLGAQIAALNLRIAIVETHDASDEDVSFLETVTFNRSGPIQFFDAETEASDWLGIS